MKCIYQMSLKFEFLLLFLILTILNISAQKQPETEIQRITTLDEIIIYNKLSTRKLLHILQKDTTFYQAFVNSRKLEYEGYHHIELIDNANISATYNAHTEQLYKNNCRFIKYLSKETTGKIINSSGKFNLTTPAVYANIFLYKDTICNEFHQSRFQSRSISKLKGIDKYKEQLRNLLFNPGAKIQGIPLMGEKLQIFDTSAFKYYNYSFEPTNYKGKSCYLFRIIAKNNLSSYQKGKIIIDEMNTWLDMNNFTILGRSYWVSYNALVYSFKIHMQIEMTEYKGFVVPASMVYNGTWKVIFKPRETVRFNNNFLNYKEPQP